MIAQQIVDDVRGRFARDPRAASVLLDLADGDEAGAAVSRLVGLSWVSGATLAPSVGSGLRITVRRAQGGGLGSR